MADITHAIYNNQYTDADSIVNRGQYFIYKKLYSVMSGSPSVAEKEMAKAAFGGTGVTTLQMPYFYISANANIEAAVIANTVSTIPDSDYEAVADTIWAAFVAAYG